jgi:sugar O-acyltransferase (sialic acid O-acetyltransferase NeuD family)
MDEVSIGEGAVFCNHTMVTVNVTIGRFFHCNLYSYVEHDCEIGDFVTFAPGVKCNGNVTIGNHAYIGSGAVIKQGIQIGEHATVGMGAVVVKDVPSHAVVAGNPAKVLKMKRNG